MSLGYDILAGPTDPYEIPAPLPAMPGHPALWDPAADPDVLAVKLAAAERVIAAADAALDRYRIIPSGGWPTGLRAYLEIRDAWEKIR